MHETEKQWSGNMHDERPSRNRKENPRMIIKAVSTPRTKLDASKSVAEYIFYLNR